MAHKLCHGGAVMEGIYDVMLADEPVGTVEVTKQGLYYRFDCRCRLSGTVICRISLECDGKHESLGVLAPSGDRFCLSTKLPVKRFGKGEPRFTALPKRCADPEGFTPIYPDEPFRYLARLQDAFMVIREGQAGVCFR